MSIAAICFIVTVGATLAITAWAARRGADRASMYAASGKVTGGQNGLAIAGDFMSATTVLGVVALYVTGGVDTGIYFLAPPIGLSLMLLWVAGPLRRLGRYTLGDVVTSRTEDPRMRLFSGVSTIVISLMYLLAQLVGAGGLISILFGFSFNQAVVIVGALMTVYVVFGGMLAATWVQIVKAVLLIIGVTVLSVLTVVHHGGMAGLYDQAAAIHGGRDLFAPGGMKLNMFSSISLAWGMTLGILGLPHLMIRFFTVPDEREARRSIVVACAIIGGVFILTFLVIGPGAVAFVTKDPAFLDADGKVRGGLNMVAVHLAQAVGGPILFGVFSAIAFATILAVVAGLTIAIASAASHDVFKALKHGRTVSAGAELWVFRLGALAAAAVAVALALVFQKENIAFLVALAFTVAASTNFPVIILTLYWRKLTSVGALTGGLVGLASSIGLIVLSPGVWVKVLHHPSAIFPSEYPALISAPLSFLVIWLVSLATQPKTAQPAGPRAISA